MKNFLKTCLTVVAVLAFLDVSQASRARAAGTYPVVVTAPVMTNTTETGANRNMDVLSVTTGTWTNAATYAYTWWRCRWVMSDLKAPIGPGLNEVTDPTATGNSGYTYSRYNIVNWQVACSRIGASGSTYEIQGADIGYWVGATVAATSPSGLVNNMSANWSANAVTAAPPVLVNPITAEGLSSCTGMSSSPCLKAVSTWKGVHSYAGWQAYFCSSPMPTDLTKCTLFSNSGSAATYSGIGGTEWCLCVASFYPAYEVLVQTVYGWDIKPYKAYWSSSVILGKVPLAPTITVQPGDGSLKFYVNPQQGSFDLSLNDFYGAVYPAKTITLKVAGQQDCVIDLATAKKSTWPAGYLCSYTGLTNGTAYTATATASNAAGDSGVTTASGTPNPPPGPPINVVTVASNKQLTITWDPPTSGTTPTSYVVWNPNGTGMPACIIDMTAIPTPPLKCTISGLTNGADYTFNVVSQAPSGYATVQTHGIPTAGSPATNVTAPTVVDAAGNQPPHVGDALTLSNGEWTTATSNFTYQWYSCSAASTSPATDPNCSVVSGATSSTYSPTNADLGKYFTGVVTATGTDGTKTTKAASASVGPVIALPTAPQNIAVTPGSGSASVSWSAPASDGGSAITNYSVRYSSDGGSTWTTASCSGTATSCDITGLTDGVSYVFEVNASNAAGTSTYSRSDNVVPNPPPGEVIDIVATGGNGSATISWLAPIDGTSPTSYDVFNATTHELVCHIDLVANPNADLSCTQTGLTNGVMYGFSVVASNEFGSSTANTEATPSAGLPASIDIAPVITDLEGSPVPLVGDELSVSDGEWSSSSGPVTYQWYSCSAPSTDPAADAHCSLIAGATSSSYFVTSGDFGKYFAATVSATGTDGSTTTAAAASIGPVKDVPHAPTNVVGSPRPNGTHLTWTAPTNTGGSPITGYIVEYSSDGGVTWNAATCSGTATNCDIPGLTDGVDYIFQVAATTALGESSFTISDAIVTPVSAPSAPEFILTEAGDGTVFVEWSQPVDNGGGPITGYVLQYSPDNGVTWITATASTPLMSATVSGLTNGTHYLFRAAGFNSAGTGSYAVTSTTTTPVTTPNAPSINTVTPNSDRTGFTVNVAPPNNTGGGAVVSYTVNVYDASGIEVGYCETTTLSCAVTGLTPNGTYTIDAVLTTVAGTSPRSRVANISLSRVVTAVNAYIRGYSYAAYDLDGARMKQIRATVRAIIAGNNTRVVVKGFANFTATKRLSRNRASTVADYMRELLAKAGRSDITVTTVFGGNTKKFGGTVLNRVVYIQGR